jgi:hypothetical protein
MTIPPTNARSHQNIHYSAPSWPCVTEPVTAQIGRYRTSSATQRKLRRVTEEWLLLAAD